MSTKLRTHGKSVVVWVLLAVLVLGLGGFGISSFTGGMRSIGSVGETDVSSSDYARALQNQMQQAQQQLGRPVTLDDARNYGLVTQVQSSLFANAALSEQARRLGLSIGDTEVARQITEASSFQSATGGFDRETYRLALRQQGFTESEFEQKVRADIARSIFRGLVTGGVNASETEVSAYTSFITDQRAFALAEVTAADLTEKVATPSEDQLQAWYKDHPDAFTAPASREITYVALTPEMLKDSAAPDEETLKAAYQAKIGTYQHPERRQVDKLVFPSEDDAKAAKAKIDAGEATLADLARARGLDIKDIDLGEVTKEDLGSAAAAVFALTKPGVAGPVDTNLGPALYQVNGILPAETTSYEEAKPDLLAEATLDNARRTIQQLTPSVEDQLASGATLEDIAKEGQLQLGHISMTADTKDGMAAYQPFRDAANKAAESDFPALESLDDGGIFALRLDKVVPAALRPFETVKADVAKAWATAELTRLKTERAKAIATAVDGGATLPSQGVLVSNEPASARSAFIEGVPAQVMQTVFATEPGKAGIATAEDKVFVVVPGPTEPAPATDPDVMQMRTRLSQQLTQALSRDIGTYYATALETELGVTLDQTAITAVQSQLR